MTARVLVLDDDEAVARAYARLLKRAGFDVQVCTSPQKALEEIGEGTRFDVVVCDGRMPEMSGVEFFRCALQLWPGIHSRILFVSGGLDDPDRNFIRKNALLLLEKPLQAYERLACEVARIVQGV